MSGGEKPFGGDWTREKLDILEKYLDAYTTALKNRRFRLIYMDAFAGTGRVELSGDKEERRLSKEEGRFLSGSAERAVKVDDKPFDKLIFVEKDSARCEKLKGLREAYPCRNIQIANEDANAFLASFQVNRDEWRGVLFLDPFATEVEWETVRKIAGLRALDTWILFPTSAIARMLPRLRQPDDISEEWVNRLNRFFGDESWRKVYKESRQGELFGENAQTREPGVGEFLEIYKDKLAELFDKRFLRKSRKLSNSKNSQLFEFLFCVGYDSKKAIRLAKEIAEHILNNL